MTGTPFSGPDLLSMPHDRRFRDIQARSFATFFLLSPLRAVKDRRPLLVRDIRAGVCNRHRYVTVTCTSYPPDLTALLDTLAETSSGDTP
ncbi:hypothetical protein F8E02_06825 [Methanoculleus sp. Wushi-C6]|uniref:Uncharacterized protein n=1 Tax=Methanoculleus caldifontis TaxID=2651577 RepID=A0ABU3X0Z5_9EURY|nr:hypothetical protein [Methanoculleus sp. Wushi-C6]MDV2481723.1 hypothetical protein [Methanoculleus sp. Wushi-C6]